MTDDIDALTGHELAAAVAVEVMGWKRFRCGPSIIAFIQQNGEHICVGNDLCDWRPHSDRNDAHRVLERCEELETARRTYALVCESMKFDFRFCTGWALLTIDPAIICRAALRAVREAKR